MTGNTYPAEAFSQAQLDSALADLLDHQRREAVATLAAGEFTPQVIRKFAELAGELGERVTVQGYQLTIYREKPYAERLRHALRNLNSAVLDGELTPEGPGYNPEGEDSDAQS